MDADKVNVPLVRIGLRNQANHEADDETILFCDKAGWAKMDKKQLGKHLCHSSATPPIVKRSDDHLVVIGFRMADHGIVQFNFPRFEKVTYIAGDVGGVNRSQTPLHNEQARNWTTPAMRIQPEIF